MTIAAYSATICAGGKWVNDTSNDNDKTVCGSATLVLPGGQDVQGRMHDVFWMLQSAIRGIQRESVDRIYFSVQVDTHGNGHHNRVDLYSVCGPGDTDAPVITIMLSNES
jgi:hypothetical protein